MNQGKKQKLLILLGIIGIIICTIIFIKLNKDSKGTYIVSNDNVLGYVNNKWYNLDNDSAIFDDYKFDLYNNSKYEGKYELRYFNSIWYYFDNNRDSHKFNGNILATGGDRKVSLESFKYGELSDDDLNIINKLLEDEGINIDDVDELSIKQKIEFDFNNDGKMEKVYSLNNINNDDSDTYFTTVIYEEKPIIISSAKENKDDLYIYSLDNILKINNQYNLIINAAKNLDINSTSTAIFRYNSKHNTLEEAKSLSKNYIDVKHKNNDNYELTIILMIVASLVIGSVIYTIVKRKREEQNNL